MRCTFRNKVSSLLLSFASELLNLSRPQVHTNRTFRKSALLNLKTKSNLRYIADYSSTEEHGNQDITQWIRRRLAVLLAISRQSAVAGGR